MPANDSTSWNGQRTHADVPNAAARSHEFAAVDLMAARVFRAPVARRGNKMSVTCSTASHRIQ
eukprot:5746072-Pyramimonas_sp.AAC.1